MINTISNLLPHDQGTYVRLLAHHFAGGKRIQKLIFGYFLVGIIETIAHYTRIITSGHFVCFFFKITKRRYKKDIIKNCRKKKFSHTWDHNIRDDGDDNRERASKDQGRFFFFFVRDVTSASAPTTITTVRKKKGTGMLMGFNNKTKNG